MNMRSFRLAGLAASILLLPAFGVVPTMSATPHRVDDGHNRDFDRDRDDARPPINHVFVIVLENEGYDTTFGPQSAAPYLAKTLTRSGVLLNQYYGTGHAS